jgi:hypothetical protein
MKRVVSKGIIIISKRRDSPYVSLVPSPESVRYFPTAYDVLPYIHSSPRRGGVVLPVNEVNDGTLPTVTVKYATVKSWHQDGTTGHTHFVASDVFHEGSARIRIMHVLKMHVTAF